MATNPLPAGARPAAGGGGGAAASANIQPGGQQPGPVATRSPVEGLDNSQTEEGRAAERDSRAVYDARGRLVGHSESGEEAEFLREVVFQAHREGKEIEAAIEYLSDLLRKKTVECEGLKTLAQENYDPVRRAVRREYEARVQSEARQQEMLRVLQKRVEDLQAERQTLQQEVASLRTLVSELERQPPPSSYNEFDDSFFNRAVYRDQQDGSGASPAAGGGAAGSNVTPQRNPAARSGSPSTPDSSWTVGSAGNHLKNVRNQTQRDVVSGLSGIDAEVAKALEQAQVFDFIKALLVKMCTRSGGPNDKNSAFPDVTTVVTNLLRERRADPRSLGRVAAMAIPVAEVSDMQRVTQIFLANNPGQIQELEMLLSQFRGREGELYEQLRERFYSEDGRARVAGNLQTATPVVSSTSDAVRAQAVSADPATELHARIMLMYKRYNPAALANPKNLQMLLQKYPPEIMLSALVEKYGPEPTAAEKRELLRSLVEPVSA